MQEANNYYLFFVYKRQQFDGGLLHLQEFVLNHYKTIKN
jgi:hypothetical protein